MNAPGPAAQGSIANRPHKGASNYESSDADLFFGRDTEATDLIARILGSRITVLYAPSGAGKTSLLNARVRPMLEGRGWSPIGVRFGNEPVEAVRVATLRWLFPPLATERAALQEAMAALTLTPAATIGDLIAAYRRVPLADPRRRELLREREDPDASYPGLLSPFKTVSPYLSRILRASTSSAAFSAHLRAMCIVASQSPAREGRGATLPLELSDTTTLGALDALLASPHLEDAQAAALAALYLPMPGLDDFFQNLVALYGAAKDVFQIVLILDQFEEIFARYRDPGPRVATAALTPDWRHRQRFFQELEGLYHALVEVPANRGSSDRLPIRYVISLREEYVGRLDRIRLFAPDITDSMYRLGLFTRDQAQMAMSKPASEYGYGYSPSVIGEVWNVLAREETVAPGPLSIVCDQLWDRIVQKRLTSGTGTSIIDDEAIERAGLKEAGASPVDVVISAYFRSFVETLPEDERVDVLDILELLITGSGTRNIVDESLLIHAPFRSTLRRKAVLDKLVDSKLLRREDRLDGRFVEITHEILIAPMQVQVQTALRESRGLRGAERALDGIRHGDIPELEAYDFRTLDEYETRFEWPAWSVALMLESAVTHGAPPERISHWARAYQRATWPRAASLLASPGEESRYLTLEETRILASESNEAALRSYPAEQIERVVRSLIVCGQPSDREAIERWTAALNETPHAHYPS